MYKVQHFLPWRKGFRVDICADTEIGICFSLHLCVVFLFLVRYSLVTSFLHPPATSFNLSNTSSSHTAYSSIHNLLTHTHNLSTHNFPIHCLLTHNLPTCPHTTCPYTTYSHTHTICLHKLSTDELLIDDIFTLTHTQLTHTYTRLTRTHMHNLSNTICSHAHTQFFTRNLLITWCGRRGIGRHRSIYILCWEVLWG